MLNEKGRTGNVEGDPTTCAGHLRVQILGGREVGLQACMDELDPALLSEEDWVSNVYGTANRRVKVV